MSDEFEGEQYSDVDIPSPPTDSNPTDLIAGESEDIESIRWVGEENAQKLRDAGFNTIVDIRNANVEEISAVEYIGENTARKIIAGDISELTGVGHRRAEKLREAGFQTAKDISEADPDKLNNVRGIGDSLITRFKIEAKGYEVNEQALNTGERNNEEILDTEGYSADGVSTLLRINLNPTGIRATWTAVILFFISISILTYIYIPIDSFVSSPQAIPDKLSYSVIGVLILTCAMSTGLSTTYWYIIRNRYRNYDIFQVVMLFLKLFLSNSLLLIPIIAFPTIFGIILSTCIVLFVIFYTFVLLGDRMSFIPAFENYSRETSRVDTLTRTFLFVYSIPWLSASQGFSPSGYYFELYVIRMIPLLAVIFTLIYGRVLIIGDKRPVQKAINQAEVAIDDSDTAGNATHAEELVERASQRLANYELEEAQNLAEEAQLAAKPSTEYLLNKAKGHTEDAKTAFNQEAYENAIEDWKAGLQTYERALVLANERGDEDIADGINTSISQVKTNLRRTRQQQANAQMRSLAADGSDLVSEGNTLFEREQYQKAQSRFASARDTYEQAIEIATEWEFNDATRLREARAEAVTAIADAQVADIEAEIQVANDIQEDAPAEAVEKYQSLRERLTALELPEEYADQRERLLESVNDGEIQATIADARQTMADAEQQADTGEWTDAKTTYQDARDQLRDVSDLAIEYGLREYRDVADSLTEVCAENIDRITNDLTSVGSVEVELDEIDIIEAAQTSSSDPIASGSSSPAWQASPSRPTNVADSLRSELPEHEVLELVGSGGNADVHKVQLTESGTVAALKVPKGSGTLSSTVIDEFVSEAETWEKIDDHSNIVSIRDWGTVPYPWLLLEYVPGSLAALDTDLSLYDKLEVLETVADTLTYTHGRGVVHLDLKPSNILIDEDMAPKIGDWGLARMLMEHTQTQVGMSLPYSAPEQLTQQAGTIDHPTDIYQLGVVSYELLTGQLPFTSDRPLDLQRQIRETEPTPPSAVVADLPSEIDEILLTALQKHPSQRYERIILFRNSLRSVRSNIE